MAEYLRVFRHVGFFRFVPVCLQDSLSAQRGIEKAKAALQEVVSSGSVSHQDQAKHLIGMVDAIDITKGGDQIGKAL